MKQWVIKNSKGQIIQESENGSINWSEVQHDVISLQFNNDGQIIKLPENMEYIQGKTASAILGTGEVEIESRYIGFKLGNNIVKIRVDEKTNNINIEVN